MATNTLEHQPGDVDHNDDPIQQHYDREFEGITGGFYNGTDVEHPNEDALDTARDSEENPETEGSSKEGKKKKSDKGNESKGRSRGHKIMYGAAGGGSSEGEEESKGRGGKLLHGFGGGARKKIGGLPRPVKYAAAGGIVGTMILFLIVIGILFSLFGSLKVIHFATILRSAGLARYTLQMQKQYTRTMVDSASLTDNSTGSLSKALGDRSLTQKLTGVNPQKRAISLGESDTLKWNFQSKRTWRTGFTKQNQFKGVTINGEEVSLDKFAQTAFGKDYTQLSYRQRLTVESQFASDVKVRLGITDGLSLRAVWFRNGVSNLFYQATGITLLKWPNKAKASFGKSPKDALKEDIDATVQKVDQDAGTVPSTSDEVNKEKDTLRQEAITNSEKGISNVGLKAKSAQVAGAAKDVSVAAFATTAACVIHDLENSFQEAGKATQDRAARLGADALTTGDQIEAGDTTGEAVGAEATRWGNADQAALYKQQTGVPLSNADQQQLVDIPNVQGPLGTFASAIKYADQAFSGASPIFQLPVIGGKAKNLTCQVVLNQYTQYGIAGAELVAAVFSAGASEGILQGVKVGIIGSLKLAGTVGVGDILGTMLDKAIHSYAGLDYSATDNNEKLYNESYVGTDLIQQTGNRQATYGKPLTGAEASAGQGDAMTAIAEANKQASFTQRYFAVDNPDSLIGTLAAQTPSSLSDFSSYTQHGLAFVGSLLSSPQLLLQRLGSLFVPRVAAADPMYTGFNAGVDEWGWTQAENNQVANDPSFSATTGALQNYVEPHLDAWTTMYGSCYAASRQQDEPSGNCVQGCSDSEEACLSTPEALHWRAYMAESCDADSMHPTPQGNCAPSEGAGSSSSPATTAGATIDMAHLYDCSAKSPSSCKTPIGCAPGTTDLGPQIGPTHGGYYHGKEVDIELCAIPGWKQLNNGLSSFGVQGANGNIAVNSRVSGAVLAMFNAAKGASITFQSVSSFRTMAYQQSLCPCDGSHVAIPGYSNHQMGLAIDWAYNGQTIGCGGPAWNWLKANASKFGYKPYSLECWHWSPTGN